MTTYSDKGHIRNFTTPELQAMLEACERGTQHTDKLMAIRIREELRGRANGYDYRNQAWVIEGRYIACSHPASMSCDCFGRIHAGEPVADNAEVR